MVLLDEIEKAHSDVFHVLLQVLDDGRLTDGQGRTVDFKNTIVIMTSNAPKEELPRLFRPEFLNRVDEIIDFHRLTEEQLKKIVDIQLASLKARLAERHIELELTDAARERLVQVGYDPAYGARPLKRAIQKEVETPLARKLVAGEVRDGQKIRVDVRARRNGVRCGIRCGCRCILSDKKGKCHGRIDRKYQSDAAVVAVEELGAVSRADDAAGGGPAADRSRRWKPPWLPKGKEVVVVAQRDASVGYARRSRTVHGRHPCGDPQGSTASPGPCGHYGAGHGARGDREGGRAPEKGYMTARVRPLPLPDDSSRETEALTLSLVELASKFVGLAQGCDPSSRTSRTCSPRNRTRCNWRS